MSAQVEDPLRRALFVPCSTKAELRDWILCYFGIDFPDAVVDPESTISPMEFIWLVYDIFRTRRYFPDEAAKYKEFSQIMAYAARASYKTLAVAVLEVVVLFHAGVDICHMAAIERQSLKAQSYVKDAFMRPYLRDYVESQSARRVEVARFVRGQGDEREELTPAEYRELSREERLTYERISNYIQIVICTVQGTNSDHVPFMVIDEVDVVENQRAYEQAKAIPDKSRGVRPLTVYISTRKSSAGLVQKELDEAAETGLKVFHWNIVDVSERCPPSRHLPEEPKIVIYRAYPDGGQRGNAIGEAEYESLPADKRKNFVRDEGYAGCLKNCKLFFACKGRLATMQSDSSTLLKDLDEITAKFRNMSPGMANAELLCRKPSDEGLVYPSFDREVHMITAPQMAEMITGEETLSDMSKDELIALMIEHAVEFTSGLDHGHTHNFAVVTGGKFGNKVFVVDVQSMPGLELDHKVKLMDDTLVGRLNPRIWPDTSEPGSNKTIKRKGRATAPAGQRGYRVMEWKKKPDSVHTGIEIVRTKLRPAVGAPELFFLRDDPGCELLAKRFSKYSWRRDEAGRLTPDPIKVDDDEMDALRYMLMNEFPPRGGTVVVPQDDPSRPPADAPPTRENYLSHFIAQSLGGPAPPPADLTAIDDDLTELPEAVIGRGSSGKIVWEF